MWYLRSSLSLVLFIINTSFTADIPSYIERCKADEHLNECIKKSGTKAIPFILNGDKRFKILNLLPLKLPEASVKTPNLDTKYKNIVIYGLETAKILDVDANLKDHKISVTIGFDSANVTADYEIKGRILLFTLDGKGQAQMQSIRPRYTCAFDYTLKEIDGKEHMKLDNFNCSSQIDRLYFHLDNLLGGNKLLEDEINAALNDNWKIVHEEIGPGFREIIFKTIEQILRNIFEQFTYDQVFLQ